MSPPYSWHCSSKVGGRGCISVPARASESCTTVSPQQARSTSIPCLFSILDAFPQPFLMTRTICEVWRSAKGFLTGTRCQSHSTAAGLTEDGGEGFWQKMSQIPSYCFTIWRKKKQKNNCSPPFQSFSVFTKHTWIPKYTIKGETSIPKPLESIFLMRILMSWIMQRVKESTMFESTTRSFLCFLDKHKFDWCLQ